MTPGTELLDNVVQPAPEEHDAMTALREQVNEISRSGYRPVLMGPDGHHVELPDSAFRALMFVVRGMAAGRTMTLMPSDQRLTTNQAAELLHVSRPHLIKLLEEGRLPYEKVGSHRRLRLEDVLAYRRARAREREEQLRELTQLSQELEEGGYS
jgi:excisionase family DNA binding protein